MTEQRADARRNCDLLLTAASAAFAEHGTDASLRHIARRAGVGIGTLYRHFPTRDALLKALLGSRFQRLRARAETLLSSDSPRDALLSWLRELAAGATTYHGLPESAPDALRDEESELYASCHVMREAAGGLLDRAQEAGTVRADLTTSNLLALAAALAWASERSDRQSALVVEQLLSVAMYGMAERSGDLAADVTGAVGDRSVGFGSPGADHTEPCRAAEGEAE